MYRVAPTLSFSLGKSVGKINQNRLFQQWRVFNLQLCAPRSGPAFCYLQTKTGPGMRPLLHTRAHTHYFVHHCREFRNP